MATFDKALYPEIEDERRDLLDSRREMNKKKKRRLHIETRRKDQMLW